VSLRILAPPADRCFAYINFSVGKIDVRRSAVRRGTNYSFAQSHSVYPYISNALDHMRTFARFLKVRIWSDAFDICTDGHYLFCILHRPTPKESLNLTESMIHRIILVIFFIIPYNFFILRFWRKISIILLLIYMIVKKK